MIKRFLFVILLCLYQILVRAQGNGVEMADAMRQNGRIYVVVAVILTIFAGIIIYLVRLDNKLRKLEKNHFKS